MTGTGKSRTKDFNLQQLDSSDRSPQSFPKSHTRSLLTHKSLRQGNRPGHFSWESERRKLRERDFKNPSIFTWLAIVDSDVIYPYAQSVFVVSKRCRKDNSEQILATNTNRLLNPRALGSATRRPGGN